MYELHHWQVITIIYNDINSSCKRDYTGYNNYNGYTNYKDYNDHNTYWGNNNFVVTLFTMIMKITTVTMITTEIWIILITSLAVITSYNDYIDNSYNKHLLSPHIQYSFQREQTVFFFRNWYKNESLFWVIR